MNSIPGRTRWPSCAAGGWTLLTAVNLMLFSLIHNPCSTTIYTIYKETGSRKWTTIAALLPLVMGFVVTFFVAQIWRTVAMFLLGPFMRFLPIYADPVGTLLSFSQIVLWYNRKLLKLMRNHWGSHGFFLYGLDFARPND